MARVEAELPASVGRVFVSIASSTRGCAPRSTRSTSPAKLARSQGSSAFHRREYPETPPEQNLACSQHIHLGLDQLKLRLDHADPISTPAPCFVSQDDNSWIERTTQCPRSSTRSSTGRRRSLTSSRRSSHLKTGQRASGRTTWHRGAIPHLLGGSGAHTSRLAPLTSRVPPVTSRLVMALAALCEFPPDPFQVLGRREAT